MAPMIETRLKMNDKDVRHTRACFCQHDVNKIPVKLPQLIRYKEGNRFESSQFKGSNMQINIKTTRDSKTGQAPNRIPIKI